MKPLLNTTLLFLLLVIGIAGGVSGQDVPDFEETRRLAEQGNATAQFTLGAMYDFGVAVPEDDAEADSIFTTLMGDQVAPRRKFIEDNALDVKNLDV